MRLVSFGGPLIKGVHTMFYSSQAEELRAFLRDKLGFQLIYRYWRRLADLQSPQSRHGRAPHGP